MTNTRKILLLILLLSFAAPASAQSIDKVVKPRKKQSSAFYLKAQYASPDCKFVSNIKDDIARSKAIGVMSHCSLGFSLRIPVWRYIYIQPEIYYSIQTDWDSAALQSGIFRQCLYAFRNRQQSHFDIPLNIGVRWEPAKAFATRAYLSGMIRMQLIQGNFTLYENYAVRAGVGIDLLNFLTFDAGYCVEMNKLTIFDDTGHYFFGLGIKL